MPAENFKDIGSNIRKWRIVKGMKQDALAREIGVSKGTLSKIENNRSVISIQILQKMTIILNIKFSMLLSDPADFMNISIHQPDYGSL